MSSIEELEASLQRRWNLATLAVYADALIARGDPRGELIAIDLEIAAHGRTPALHARRRELAQGWLADTEHGFVSAKLFRSGNEEPRTVASLFASPAGRWLRHLQLATHPAQLVQQLRAVARHPLPWLHELGMLPLMGRRPIPDEDVAAIATAAPHLDRLWLLGRSVMRTPIPASVRSLLVAPESLVVGAAPVPNVVDLTIIPVSNDPARLSRDAGLVNPRLFPALRELDLRSSTWEEPHDDAISLRTFVEQIDGFDRIVRLRIPPPPPERVADVLVLVERYPQLVIHVGRSHTAIAAAHPRLHVPPPHPWPAWDVARRSTLHVLSHEVGLGSLVLAVEKHDATMTAAARAAWGELWPILCEPGWDPAVHARFELDTEVVRAALEALHDDAPFDVDQLTGPRVVIERRAAA